MAVRTDSPLSGPPSPSSTMTSPETNTIPLSVTMSSEENDSPATSALNTPNHSTTSLPRTQTAGKGGCWTCRVRRKKCDEQREGDSCKTCKRLTIKCLGWGPKRPEWMRDKQAVDNYKAGIKARLTQKGLIRGQPRTNPSHSAHHNASQKNAAPYRRPTSTNTHNASTSSASHPLALSQPEYHYPHFDPDGGFLQGSGHGLMPSLPGASNSGFDQISAHGGSSIGDLDPTTSGHTFPAHSLTSSSSSSSYFQETNDFLFSTDPFGLNLEYQAPSSPSSMGFQYNVPAGQSTFHEERVSFYFQEVHKVQFVFSGDKFTEITDRAISEDPRGAVAFAICALADLYSSRMRVRQGLEAPSLNPQHSQPMYLQQEAMHLLTNNKTIRGVWTDNDAIAALHLVSFSQLCGGQAEWETPFRILCEWLNQTALHVSENPQPIFNSMSPTTQTLVKAVLWFDTLASISLMKPPVFVNIWKRLLNDEGATFNWNGGERLDASLKMDDLSGCPDEAMLAIAEVSALAHWKATELRNGTLSYPKLIRRGDQIEKQARRRSASLVDIGLLQDPLNVPSVNQTGVFMSDVTRTTIGDIFRETAVLYLHTVLSDSSPGVSEINASVAAIVRLFYQLPQSNIDRALVFPICLAGCMTNDSNYREFFKQRLQFLDDSLGNVLQTRLLMEAVWQKRDVSGKPVDVREVIRERGLNLLLV
ncbi:fungal-specific transcription factor domain-containing protein [Cyathus striatus]|nr:fungal-specific transcription factor domain-containing protein [Cyathus striatus]